MRKELIGIEQSEQVSQGSQPLTGIIKEGEQQMNKEKLEVPQYGIEMIFWDNESKEEVSRGGMSNSAESIISELEQMISVIRELTD